MCRSVCVLLVGQYSINLRDDRGQLSQAEHRSHHSMVVTDLENHFDSLLDYRHLEGNCSMKGTSSTGVKHSAVKAYKRTQKRS